jgi:hypothetical protein
MTRCCAWPARQAPRRCDVQAAATRRAKAPAPTADVVHGQPLLQSQPAHLRVTDAFLAPALAQGLRGEYERKMGNPREVRPDRFVWDLWCVPGQYTQLRTPAHDFFESGKLFAEVESALLDWGRTELGVSALSPLWLSLYVAGCGQELHADVPHGPWAFVLSLSPKERRFSGGETFILQPHVLDLWRGFQAGAVTEEQQLATRVAPEFNRLTVFDARFPHGVTRVDGTMDPMHGRLVLHGWFLEPTPFFEGALSEEDATDALSSALEPLFGALADDEQAPLANGVLVVRIHINAGGGVTDIRALSDTLRPHPGCGDIDEARAVLLALVQQHLQPARFPTAPGASSITMPLVFE